MGRFSPTVLPDYGPSLGSHLLQAAQTFMQMKDRKRQQGREDVADKQNAELFRERMDSMHEEGVQRQIALAGTPGVSMEPTGVRDALNQAANLVPQLGGTPFATPGGGQAPGVSVGQARVGNAPYDVRYDAAQSPTNLARAQQFKKIAEWQSVTNPATGKPFSQGEAYLLGTGSAKYTDFKPPRPYRPNGPHYIQDEKLGWGSVDPNTHEFVPITAKGSPVMGMPRSLGRGANGETPEVAATRRDLAGTRTQQIRAETETKGLRQEQRQLVNDHGKKIAGPMGNLTTRADSVAATRYNALPALIDKSQKRLDGLTTKADSIGGALEQQRAKAVRSAQTGESTTDRVHGPNAGRDESPYDPQAFDDSITEEELHDALANGAQDEDAVRSHVQTLRGGQ